MILVFCVREEHLTLRHACDLQSVDTLPAFVIQYACKDALPCVCETVKNVTCPLKKIETLKLFASSGFFRALLYGGMKESQPQAEVCLEETRAEAFSMLLHYLYTGRASLSSAREEVLLDFLGLAHRYGLQPLEDSTSEFLRTILHTNNVCLVFDVASLYSLSALSAACCAYMDRHAPEVLNSDGFLMLSKVRGLQNGV